MQLALTFLQFWVQSNVPQKDEERKEIFMLKSRFRLTQDKLVQGENEFSWNSKLWFQSEDQEAVWLQGMSTQSVRGL